METNNNLEKRLTCKLTKDKHVWWLEVDNLDIPIGYNQFTEKNIKYFEKLYKDLGN